MLLTERPDVQLLFIIILNFVVKLKHYYHFIKEKGESIFIIIKFKKLNKIKIFCNNEVLPNTDTSVSETAFEYSVFEMVFVSQRFLHDKFNSACCTQKSGISF